MMVSYTFKEERKKGMRLPINNGRFLSFQELIP
jgi:hypothetical protein